MNKQSLQRLHWRIHNSDISQWLKRRWPRIFGKAYYWAWVDLDDFKTVMQSHAPNFDEEMMEAELDG